MPDQSVEQEIQAKGLTAPRITPADIEANIEHEMFITGEQLAKGFARECPARGPIPKSFGNIVTLTLCVLVLKNGFTVTGESACASPENFDAELGRKIARQNAINKVWPLMGYELRARLTTGS